MSDTNKRAWIYTRLNAPDDGQDSLKRQEKELIDCACQIGLSVIGSSSDLGSGTDMDRAGLISMTAAAREGQFDVLLVKSISRIGRNIEQAVALIHQLAGLRVAVISSSEGLLSPSDIFPPAGRMRSTLHPGENTLPTAQEWLPKDLQPGIPPDIFEQVCRACGHIIPHEDGAMDFVPKHAPVDDMEPNTPGMGGISHA